ncbi:MAG: glycosyltransferase, partial [Candidatus Gastranaerophilaceae bacterium]
MNNILNENPNFLQRTFLKKCFAEKIYEKYLIPMIKFYNQDKKPNGFKSVLHINTAVGKGGAAKVAHDFLNTEINKKGFNSKILVNTVYSNKDSSIIELPQKNPKLHKTLHKASRALGWLDFFNPSSFFIPEMEEFKNADVIHLHNIHGAYFSPFLLPQLTALKPTVWTLHDEQSYTGHCSYSFECQKWLENCGNCPRLDYYPKLKKDTTEFLINTKKQIYEKADLTIVCPSMWLADRAKRSILKDKDVRVIYNGINTDIFKPYDKEKTRIELGLPSNKKILLFSASGSLKNPQKGGDFIIESYNELKKDENIVFVCIGGNENIKNPNWIDIPYIQDPNLLAKYYSAADIFIYPSLVEAFGLVIAESMACETPVVAFNYSAVPEIIDHKQNGYLANYKDKKDFINGIKSLLFDSELLLNFGKNARIKIVNNFTLDKMVD